MRKKFNFFLTLTLILIFSNISFAQTTLKTPSEINAGSDFKVEWKGPNNKGDFITIIKADAEEKKYGLYKYTKKGPILKFTALDEPGNYEIRYVDGETKSTLTRVPLKILETSATVQAPTEVSAGAEVTIYWTGPNHKRDFITIVEADTEERKYGNYKYLRHSKKDRDGKSYIKINAPEVAGSYEIRYLSGQKYYTLGRTPLNITASEANLEVQQTAKAGSEIKVFWTGPNNKQDFITIVEANAEEKKYGKFKYLRHSKKDRDGKDYVTLLVPDTAGLYEIRYLTGQKYFTLARTTIKIISTEATVNAPAEAAAGSEIKVFWTGPNNKQDFITIVEADAEERKYGKFRYLRHSKQDKDGKSYIILQVPEVVGSYEVRYLTGQKYLTLARTPVAVTEVVATLDSPSEVTTKEKFNVSWTGPNNKHDYIAIVESGAAEGKYLNYAYTKRGNPVKIEAPKSPGTYELRYSTGQLRKTLAYKSIEVLQSKEPGTIVVVTESENTDSLQTSALGAVELILDASGSMLKKLDGSTRIDIAKKAISSLIQNSLEQETPFAMRVFGHKEADSCRTDLEIPLKPLDKTAVINKIKTIQAKNLAKTPIGNSLALVAKDLTGIEGKAVIVLVTDGEETCDGDPKQAIESLKNSGYDIRVNIVGFAIDELMLKETFREWARIGNGSYFDANNAEELGENIKKAIEIPYEVINSSGGVVATGVVNGEAVEAPPGVYSIRISGKDGPISNVKINPEEETKLSIK